MDVTNPSKDVIAVVAPHLPGTIFLSNSLATVEWRDKIHLTREQKVASCRKLRLRRNSFSNFSYSVLFFWTLLFDIYYQQRLQSHVPECLPSSEQLGLFWWMFHCSPRKHSLTLDMIFKLMNIRRVYYAWVVLSMTESPVDFGSLPHSDVYYSRIPSVQ